VHNADMGLAVPVFYKGELMCFIAAAVHTGEAGGTEPGGTCNTAKTKYDEGLLVPPIKIGENYQLREDILNMLAAMTRDPRTMILDIKARLAAARIAQRRVLEVIEEKGPEFFIGGLRRILTQTGEAARRRVRSSMMASTASPASSTRSAPKRVSPRSTSPSSRRATRSRWTSRTARRCSKAAR
jgi:N-methylhydantoinase B/oxoprolinase/acetone carboxylase alpha subunit